MHSLAKHFNTCKVDPNSDPPIDLLEPEFPI